MSEQFKALLNYQDLTGKRLTTSEFIRAWDSLADEEKVAFMTFENFEHKVEPSLKAVSREQWDAYDKIMNPGK